MWRGLVSAVIYRGMTYERMLIVSYFAVVAYQRVSMPQYIVHDIQNELKSKSEKVLYEAANVCLKSFNMSINFLSQSIFARVGCWMLDVATVNIILSTLKTYYILNYEKF
jgi:hypothetical protein